MQKFYDDVTIHGAIRASTISGELSEQCRAPIDRQIAALCDDLQEIKTTAASLHYTLGGLAEKYNKAIEVINNLSERVTALESNYDPTVID